MKIKNETGQRCQPLDSRPLRGGEQEDCLALSLVVGLIRPDFSDSRPALLT
ncbi:hypothetical protein HMPREF1557_00688 [Streptococcus sobrinus W1703]|uniref:Uncharacterized protein n=1 Tax=Streptococcus sobrinus W1703 TaxID=1227275 RepID=U2JD17_9STRE|nr:hypothetical protein HMPREF1557_00688 [Streptococcus sobrinus W1703]